MWIKHVYFYIFYMKQDKQSAGRKLNVLLDDNESVWNLHHWLHSFQYIIYCIFATLDKPYIVRIYVAVWKNTLANSQKSCSAYYALIKLSVRHHNKMDISVIDSLCYSTVKIPAVKLFKMHTCYHLHCRDGSGQSCTI